MIGTGLDVVRLYYPGSKLVGNSQGLYMAGASTTWCPSGAQEEEKKDMAENQSETQTNDAGLLHFGLGDKLLVFHRHKPWEVAEGPYVEANMTVLRAALERATGGKLDGVRLGRGVKVPFIMVRAKSGSIIVQIDGKQRVAATVSGEDRARLVSTYLTQGALYQPSAPTPKEATPATETPAAPSDSAAPSEPAPNEDVTPPTPGKKRHK
jgi:hypothetical protein